MNVEGSITTTTVYVGGIFEKVTIGATTEYRHHVMGAEGAVAIHTRGGSNVTRYLLKDHLGSVDRITDASGNVLVQVSDDSFGKRRDGADWVGPPSSGDWTQIAAATRRGFTGHEHLDNLGLIHMNGRVYDPALGRFIQADPFVPDPLDAQSFNRYSYVRNRPLSSVDPSGFWDLPTRLTDGGGIGDPMNLRGVRGGHVSSPEEGGGQVPGQPPPPRSGVAHGNTVGRSATPGDYVRGCVPGATPGINPGGGSPCGTTPSADWIGFCESGGTCAMTRMEQDYLEGRITREELDEYYRRNAEGALTVASPPGAAGAFGGLVWAARAWKAKRAARSINPSVIRDIKALADGAKLTRKQVQELGKNIDAILSKSLPAKAASGRVQDVVDLLKSDSRFRFIDQVPGAQQKIADALSKYGVPWP